MTMAASLALPTAMRNIVIGWEPLSLAVPGRIKGAETGGQASRSDSHYHPG